MATNASSFSANSALPKHVRRVLHLEDSRFDHELASAALKSSEFRYELTRVETLESFVEQVNSSSFDAIVADYRLPGFTAIDAWMALQIEAPGQASLTPPPFIILSGAIGESAAVDAVKQGISDYLLKDNINKLDHVISRAIEVHESRLAKALADAELTKSERRLAELTEYLQSSIEQERAAIAREVHDDIGGALTAVKFDLAWIVRNTKDTASADHARAAGEMLQHAIGASQRILHNLRPAILEQGLVAAVQWLASDFERRTNVRTTVHAPSESVNLSNAIQLVAYRTTQEALTNISKHAEANAVMIDLSDAEGVLTLEITDKGRGLDKTALEKPKAFGIRGLHERAKTVGGWMDVSSRPGVGTSIILSVPLKPGLSDYHAEVAE
jgi:two-component system sensor histidine kinase UhpB